MTLPSKHSLDYSYTAFQQSQGNNSFPGTQLDNDLLGLKATTDGLVDALGEVVRDDGKLQNGIVSKNSLAEDVLLGLPAPRPWATATAYAVDDTATINNSLYVCLVAHTSGVFATDLTANRWALLIEFTVPAAILDGSVTTPKIAAGAVTESKLASGAVTNGKLADGAVSAAKLSSDIQTVPIGATTEWDGLFPPAGWLFKAGQAISRTTYNGLLAVLAPTVTGTTTVGSPIVTGIPVDLRNIGVEGAFIEGTGVSLGTTIVSVTVNSITLSSGAIASNAEVQLRLFPHGAGDGSTTFNLPDDRDRAAVGRGNMGGTAASRVTLTGAGASDLNTLRLGAAGGVDRHVLVAGEIAAHDHDVAVTINDPGHAHANANAAANTSSSGTPGVLVAQATSAPTSTAFTGITATADVAPNVGGVAHRNVQPSRVTNKIIFTGVA